MHFSLYFSCDKSHHYHYIELSSKKERKIDETDGWHIAKSHFIASSSMKNGICGFSANFSTPNLINYRDTLQTHSHTKIAEKNSPPIKDKLRNRISVIS